MSYHRMKKGRVNHVRNADMNSGTIAEDVPEIIISAAISVAEAQTSMLLENSELLA